MTRTSRKSEAAGRKLKRASLSLLMDGVDGATRPQLAESCGETLVWVDTYAPRFLEVVLVPRTWDNGIHHETATHNIRVFRLHRHDLVKRVSSALPLPEVQE